MISAAVAVVVQNAYFHNYYYPYAVAAVAAVVVAVSSEAVVAGTYRCECCYSENEALVVVPAADVVAHQMASDRIAVDSLAYCYYFRDQIDLAAAAVAAVASACLVWAAAPSIDHSNCPGFRFYS